MSAGQLEVGGYYWFREPQWDEGQWDVCVCHDLTSGPGGGPTLYCLGWEFPLRNVATLEIGPRIHPPQSQQSRAA